MADIADLNLDPASVDPDYIVNSQLVIVFTNNQEVILDRAAHASSVVVNLVTELGTTTLTLGVDYVIAAANYDYMAMSRAVMYASAHTETFSGIIVQSIKMTRATIESYQISIAYRTLEVDAATYLPGGVGPEPTAGLMKEIIDRILVLESSFNPVTDIATELLSGIRCLPEDPTGTAADNWIDDERHHVDTTHSEQVIRCSAGSIYRHDLELVKEIDGTSLVEGTDYVVFGVDHARTTASYHPSGVYDYICVTQRALVGVLIVKYHAYGGQFTDLDGYAMKQALANLLRYLKTIGFNSEGGSGVCATLGAISSLHSVTSVDTAYHWLTIAKLYRDDTLTTLRKSFGIFRVRGDDVCKFDVTFNIDLDLDRDRDQVKVELSAGKNPINWTSETQDADVVNQIIPRIRCVWADGIESGVYLQFGFPVRPVGTVSIIVDNFSTTDSYWTLIDGSIVTHGVQDDDLLLADGLTTWVSETHQQVQRILGYRDGVVLFSGYFEMYNNAINDPGMLFIGGPLLSTDVPIWAVKTVEFQFYDRYEDVTFVHSVSRSSELVDGDIIPAFAALFYPNDLCGLSARIGNDVGTYLSRFLLTPMVGSHSLGAGMVSNPKSRFAVTAIRAIF